jgi:hypothetical protein
VALGVRRVSNGRFSIGSAEHLVSLLYSLFNTINFVSPELVKHSSVG